MKTIELINQHIPIWSVLKGDHACGDIANYLSTKLITNPDFLDPKQNSLRSEYLKSTRGRRWLYDYLADRSFAVVQLERTDVENALCVWKDVPLVDVAKQFQQAYQEQRSFSYKDIEKPWDCVRDVKHRQRVLKTPEQGWLTSPDDDLDYHRTIWMRRRKDQKLQVIDGTHRSLATVWRYLLDKDKMPKTWFAITFNE